MAKMLDGGEEIATSCRNIEAHEQPSRLMQIVGIAIVKGDDHRSAADASPPASLFQLSHRLCGAELLQDFQVLREVARGHRQPLRITG